MRKITLCLLVCLSTLSVFSQSPLHRKAERCFNRFEFITAAHTYERIVKKNPADKNAWARLEQCYDVLSYQAKKMQVTYKPTQTAIVPVETIKYKVIDGVSGK